MRLGMFSIEKVIKKYLRDKFVERQRRELY